MSAMRLAVDFDNTLIDYDPVFLAAARERGLVDGGFRGSKRAVRDAIRSAPNGEITWQRLQGYVYGVGITKAAPFCGALAFLRRCRHEEVPIFIVSHKTQFGHHDPARIDLRQAALSWMTRWGFFAPDELGVPPDHVYFADTRAAKLRKITELGCTHAIDDLEEVFADPLFPQDVKRILFGDYHADACCDVVCPAWACVASAVFGDPG
jgi:hypothetical protein